MSIAATVRKLFSSPRPIQHQAAPQPANARPTSTLPQSSSDSTPPAARWGHSALQAERLRVEAELRRLKALQRASGQPDWSGNLAWEQQNFRRRATLIYTILADRHGRIHARKIWGGCAAYTWRIETLEQQRGRLWLIRSADPAPRCGIGPRQQIAAGRERHTSQQAPAFTWDRYQGDGQPGLEAAYCLVQGEQLTQQPGRIGVLSTEVALHLLWFRLDTGLPAVPSLIGSLDADGTARLDWAPLPYRHLTFTIPPTGDATYRLAEDEPGVAGKLRVLSDHAWPSRAEWHGLFASALGVR